MHSTDTLDTLVGPGKEEPHQRGRGGRGLPLSLQDCAAPVLLLNSLLGTTLVALPFAVDRAGIVIGIGAHLVVATLTGYCAFLLGDMLTETGSSSTVQLASKAGMPLAGKTIQSMIVCSTLFSSVGSKILVCDIVYDLLRIPLWKTKCALLVIEFFFCFLRDLSSMGFTSFLGVFFAFGLGAYLMWRTVTEDVAFEKVPLSPSGWLAVGECTGLVLAAFNTANHADFRETLRNPNLFNPTVMFANSLALLTSLGVALGGVLLFAGEVEPEVTTNLARRGRDGEVISWALAAISFTKLPLNLRLLANNFEILFLPGVDMTSDEISGHGFRTSLRCLLCLVVFVGAILFPAFGEVMGILGSVMGVFIMLVFPLMMAIKLRAARNALESMVFPLLLLASLLVSLFSTGCILWKTLVEGTSREAKW
uniref:Amino acid transporter transmembrane domain-containing protein n=1 Tax=Chromera velia CCMP2878 TaxID=1169474 RepID=A0A0G4I5Y6_9ALVE|eukprot:Cvel_82.t1-p1 / transcript=Cvel_82.t1 / gene=Cvel_82 / organism=Chromera_velia_CCMP2878 / gene_product=hypothetical protein / transcript_product=hypothetical protein / location=Cvel_scaffold6:248853-250615(+) / protein_length=421 / sequence_SO=supercontig / SO=protein_coding / is_pseudo=false